MDKTTADDVMGPPAPDAGEVTIRVAPARDVELPGLEGGSDAGGGFTPAAPAAGVASAVELPTITPELVQPAVEELYRYVARRRGPHWVLDDDEARNIAEPLAGELDDLLANAPFLGGAAAAIGGRRLQLALAFGFATGPRIIEDGRLAQARADARRNVQREPMQQTSETRDAGDGLANLLPN